MELSRGSTILEQTPDGGHVHRTRQTSGRTSYRDGRKDDNGNIRVDQKRMNSRKVIPKKSFGFAHPINDEITSGLKPQSDMVPTRDTNHKIPNNGIVGEETKHSEFKQCQGNLQSVIENCNYTLNEKINVMSVSDDKTHLDGMVIKQGLSLNKNRHQQPSSGNIIDNQYEAVCGDTGQCLYQGTVDLNGIIINKGEPQVQCRDGKLEYRADKRKDLSSHSKRIPQDATMTDCTSSTIPSDQGVPENNFKRDSPPTSDKNNHLNDLGLSLLKCEICLNEFNQDEWIPRILPCLHIICQSCVSQRTTGETLVCPICKLCHILSTEKDSLLPEDKTRHTIRDFVKVKCKNGVVSCKDCPDEQCASFFCRDCFAFMCTECRSAHLRNFMSRKHVVMPSAHIIEAGIKPRSKPEICKIPGHDGSILEFYCESRECNVAVCKLCVILKHDPKNGHSVRKLSTVYKENALKIVDFHRRLRDKLNKTRDVKFETDDVIKSINSKEESIRLEIDKDIDMTIVKIEQRRKQLKEILHKKCKEKRDILNDQKDNLRQELMMMADAITFCSYQIKHALESDFLNLTNIMTKRLADLKNKKVDLCPNDNNVITFNNQEFETKLDNFVSRLGNIETTAVYPLATHVELTDIPIGIHSEFMKVTLCDLHNTPQIDKSHNMKMDVLDAEGKLVTNSSQVMPLPTGQFSVSLTAAMTGEYTVIVDVLGTRVKELGYNFRVKDLGDVDKWHADILCQGFSFDSQCVHNERSLSQDGRCIFSSNINGRSTIGGDILIGQEQGSKLVTQIDIKDDRDDQRLKKYCGTLGTKPFEFPGIYYYEVEVKYKVLVHLTRNAMVFEIGLGSLESIYSSFYVGAHAQAWSFSAERCNEHNQVCHKFRHRRELLTHVPVSSDLAGTSVSKKYGFLVDLRTGSWTILDCSSGRVLFVFKDIQCRELNAWPVFGTYNPYSVDVKMKLNTGHSIDRIPLTSS